MSGYCDDCGWQICVCDKKYSHNDYFCENPIDDAVEAGLSAFEADLVYTGGEIMLSHSWRPLKCMCYGSLEEVYLKPLYIRACTGKKSTLILEPKSVRKDMLPALYNLLNKYKHPNITYITGVQYRYFWQHKRLVWMYDFHLLCRKGTVRTYDKRLETDYHDQVDVYKKRWWMI